MNFIIKCTLLFCATSSLYASVQKRIDMFEEEFKARTTNRQSSINPQVGQRSEPLLSDDFFNKGTKLDQSALSTEKINEKDLEKSRKELKLAARGGDKAAVNKIADMGEILQKKRRLKEAKEWLELTAHHNHPQAQRNLGVIAFERGDTQEKINEKDLEKSKKELKLAARGGDKAAINKIADMGEILQKRGKLKEAKEWLELAAQYNHPQAQCNLGIIAFERGDAQEKINKKDLAKSRKWLERAAKGGNKAAVNKIADIREILQKRGKLKEAKEWLELAAQYNHPQAQRTLGVIAFERGDMQEAQEWVKKAVENANKRASDKLFDAGNIFHAEGDIQNAKKRWEQAAQLNHEGARDKLRDLAAKESNSKETESRLISTENDSASRGSRRPQGLSIPPKSETRVEKKGLLESIAKADKGSSEEKKPAQHKQTPVDVSSSRGYSGSLSRRPQGLSIPPTSETRVEKKGLLESIAKADKGSGKEEKPAQHKQTPVDVSSSQGYSGSLSRRPQGLSIPPTSEVERKGLLGSLAQADKGSGEEKKPATTTQTPVSLSSVLEKVDQYLKKYNITPPQHKQPLVDVSSVLEKVDQYFKKYNIIPSQQPVAPKGNADIKRVPVALKHTQSNTSSKPAPKPADLSAFGATGEARRLIARQTWVLKNINNKKGVSRGN